MRPRRITIHCAATPNGVAYPAAKIKAYHMAPPPEGRGWSDIGYHYVLQPDGSYERGRELTEQGAHVEGENEDNVGVCLIGTDRFTRKQISCLRDLLNLLCTHYSIPEWEIRVHNQFESCRAQKKTCPNFEIGGLLTWYLVNDWRALQDVLLEEKDE